MVNRFRHPLRCAIICSTVIGVGVVSCLSSQVDTDAPWDGGVSVRESANLVCLEARGDIKLVPTETFTSDGCSMWPDGSWQQCCIAHDMRYWCGGSKEDRKAADIALQKCVSNASNKFNGTLMKGGVYIGGSKIFPTPWRWGYGWPYGADMERPEEDD